MFKDLNEALARLKQRKKAKDCPPPGIDAPVESAPESKKPRLEAAQPPPANARASGNNSESALQASIARLHARFASQTSQPPASSQTTRNSIEQPLSTTASEPPSLHSVPPKSLTTQTKRLNPSEGSSSSLNSRSSSQISTPAVISPVGQSKASGNVHQPPKNPTDKNSTDALSSRDFVVPSVVPRINMSTSFSNPKRTSSQTNPTTFSESDRRNSLRTSTPQRNIPVFPTSPDAIHSPNSSSSSIGTSSFLGLKPNRPQVGRRRPPGPAGYVVRRQNGQADRTAESSNEQSANEEVFLRSTLWPTFMSHHGLTQFYSWDGHELVFQNEDSTNSVTVFPVGKILQGAYSTVFRVPGVAVVVKRVLDQDRNAYVLFSDPTGEITGSVACSVFKKQYQFLDPGTVWVLKDVSLICPNPKDVYLNIVAANLVQVFSANQNDVSSTDSILESSNILDDCTPSPPKSPMLSPPSVATSTPLQKGINGQVPTSPQSNVISTPLLIATSSQSETEVPTSIRPTAVATPISIPTQSEAVALTQNLIDEFLDEFELSD
ncbi:hypothetical protein DSO57_1038029 [Entomophthora muscae]|uniref:Uncharacterized protein n=1 Tax=Entomophthora muscae TaxID=34485 RepID=A0ACC2TKP5_9FUNG|nr:hypothetical protein DSO57_1038029 [Entomophthora muscae]